MPHDWHILQTGHPRVLITGPPDAIEASLTQVLRYARGPIKRWTPDTPFPSAGDAKTMVIRDVDTLSRVHQEALFAELTSLAGRECQVISTSRVSLYERVSAGLFLGDLYYRLNMLLLDALARTATRDLLLIRVPAEFLEMPGLRLTLRQAERLCGADRMLCHAVLDTLVDQRFLCVKGDGAYARASDSDVVRRPARARLEPRRRAAS